MTNVEKAKEWFLMEGFNAQIYDGALLYVTIGEFVEVEVSHNEIEYRAELYQAQIDEGSITVE